MTPVQSFPGPHPRAFSLATCAPAGTLPCARDKKAAFVSIALTIGGWGRRVLAISHHFWSVWVGMEPGSRHGVRALALELMLEEYFIL